MIVEAICGECGEVFNPDRHDIERTPTTVYRDEPGWDQGVKIMVDTAIHFNKMDGSDCGGRGRVTGEWG